MGKITNTNPIYERIAALCKQNNVTIIKLCNDIGVSRSALSELRRSTTRTPSAKVLSAIAEYFGVEEKYILTGEKERRIPSTEDIQFALFGAEEGITDEMWQDVLDTIEFIKFKHRGGSNNGNG